MNVKSVKPTQEEAENAIRVLLAYTGDNPDREGLKETPQRVARAFSEYYQGYDEDPEQLLDRHFTDVAGYQDAVILKDIPFYSHCEHHMAPIHGTVSIAYLPDTRVVGISKLARLVNAYARRLQIQEKMTAEIAETLQHHLEPKGVAVYIKAVHHCMLGRGVNIQGATLVTSHFTGSYLVHEMERHHIKTLLSE